MTWHIFKKDLRLLWPLVTLVIFARIINAALWLALGPLMEPRDLFSIAWIFPGLVVFATGVTVLAAIHQDVIPGDIQDWLIRPVKRSDLVLAKLLFIVLAVQVPQVMIDAAESLLQGFPIGASLGSAVERSIGLLCLLSLPVAGLAAVTRNLTQALVACGFTAAAAAFLLIFSNLMRLLPADRGGSALLWATPFTWIAIAIVATAAIFWLQYGRRRTFPARGVAAAAILLGFGAFFIPWRPVFALQSRFSPQKEAAAAIDLAFAPGLPKPARGIISPGAAAVALPLRVTGLPANGLLMMDRAEVSLVSSGGETIYRHASYLSLDGAGPLPRTQLMVRGDAAPNGVIDAHQTIFLPVKIYGAAKHRALRLEVDYSLTLFAPEARGAVPAVAGDQRLAGGTRWCKTTIDNDAGALDLHCLSPVTTDCFTAALENAATAQRNPATQYCEPDYGPFPLPYLSLNRFTTELKFRDPQDRVTYPVDASQLSDARVILQSYRPAAHFTRRLVIPDIQLADWDAAAPQAVAQ